MRPFRMLTPGSDRSALRWLAVLAAAIAATIALVAVTAPQAPAASACPAGVTPVLTYQAASMSIPAGNEIAIPPALTVTCGGAPAAGIDVAFAVANAGASAALPGPQSAIADDRGVVAAPPVQSGLVAGSFSLQATVRGVTTTLPGTVTGRLSGIQLPALPPADIVSFYSDCPGQTNVSKTCLTTSVDDIDVGRRAEHLGPLVLPSNFTKLTPQEQLFTIINLERTARGLPAVTGLAADLNAVAQAGAQQFEDATPILTGYRAADVTAAVNVPNAIAAVYFWVYDDGLLPNGTSGNGDCTPTSGHCWSHRTAILTNIPATGCLTPCVMGTGYYHSSQGSQNTAFTTDFEYQLTPSTDPMMFTWASELPYLPACERGGDTCMASTTPPKSIYPAGECPAPGYDYTKIYPSVSALKAHVAGSVHPGRTLAITLTHAAPGHVSVTVKHGSKTVATTALLYCTSTVHLHVPISAKKVHKGESLLVKVVGTEDRAAGETDVYVSVS
jgi:hypothetical protein